MKITNIEMLEDGFPTLKITVNDEGETYSGYLQPFRAYSIQVSGTADGDGDCGSTAVFNIPNIVKSISREEAEAIIRMAAEYAVANFIQATPREASFYLNSFWNPDTDEDPFGAWIEAVHSGLMRPECKFGFWS